ncbi:methyltransferase domain-containing protein [soil metagenome]
MSRCIGSIIAVWSIIAWQGPVPAAVGQDRPAPPEGINENFQDPDVEQFLGRFEAESREVYAQRHEVVKALGLKPGMAIADIGAGTGLYTMLFAEQVKPDGKVYAVDIAPKFLAFIADRAEKAGLGEVVETIQATQTSTALPPDSIDVAFICDNYHHFEHPEESLASIQQALRPDGRLVIIEFDRREGISSEFILGHVRADKATFLNEIRSAGFERVPIAGGPEYEENFFAVLRKVDRSEDAPQQSPETGGEGDNG